MKVNISKEEAIMMDKILEYCYSKHDDHCYSGAADIYIDNILPGESIEDIHHLLKKMQDSGEEIGVFAKNSKDPILRADKRTIKFLTNNDFKKIAKQQTKSARRKKKKERFDFIAVMNNVYSAPYVKFILIATLIISFLTYLKD